MVARISGVRKAAILTLSLGESGANEILKCLSADEVERIAREIAVLGGVQAADTELVLEEAHSAAISADGRTRGGIESVQRLLKTALPSQDAGSIYDRVAKSVSSSSGFSSLTMTDPTQLSKFVQAEQPQTIALILAHLDGPNAAQQLSLLPEELRGEVVSRMANLEEVSPEIVDQVSIMMSKRLRSLGATSHESAGGIRAVASLLNRLERSVSSSILEKVESESSELAVSIRELMFVFEDLVKVQDTAFREIVQRADRKVLTLALKGASEGIRERFFKNMSQRAGEVLKEELDVLGAVRLKDVEQAQQEIVGIARKLEEEGLLSTGAGGGDEYVV